MSKRRYLAALALACCSSYSYSEIISGVTNNAAATGLQWTMPGVLPQESGLTVGGIVYRYTAIKNSNDPLLVNIQNENALSSGLIFKHTDNWSNLPSNTINKSVPISDIPIQYWGNGSITTEGIGRVADPTVIYTYKYDTCYNPINDPRCPGYAKAMHDFLLENGLLKETTLDTSLEDQIVKQELEKKAKLEEEIKHTAEEIKRKDNKKEIAKNAADNTIALAQSVSQKDMIDAMNNVPNFALYYGSMNGGVYKDTLQFAQKKLPDSRLGQRVGLAQQVLHTQMVESQYKLK
jgi:hypothetical protein